MFILLKRLLSFALLITGMYAPCYALNLSKIDHLYFFGDSLTDTGYMNNAPANLIPKEQTPVYTTPHGHVWAYYLAQKLGKTLSANNIAPPPLNPNVSGTLHGNDYAAGGAMTIDKGFGMPGYEPPSLTYQITQFLKTHHPDQYPNNLYFIWIGNNDLLLSLKESKKHWPLKRIALLRHAVIRATHTIAQQITALHNAGATHIIVFNQIALGDSPYINHSWISRHIANELADYFNHRLKSELAKLKRHGIVVPVFDVHKAFNSLLEKINKTGVYSDDSVTLTNTKDMACLTSKKEPNVLAIACRHWVAPSIYQHYVFADIVHPTNAAHQVLADKIYNWLQTLPATSWSHHKS